MTCKRVGEHEHSADEARQPEDGVVEQVPSPGLAQVLKDAVVVHGGVCGCGGVLRPRRVAGPGWEVSPSSGSRQFISKQSAGEE